MKVVRFVALLLMVVGSLNWGLVGLFEYDLVSNLFGSGSMASRIIFDLVGLAGLMGIGFLCTCCCSRCKCDSGCKSGCGCNCHKKD